MSLSRSHITSSFMYEFTDLTSVTYVILTTVIITDIGFCVVTGKL